MYVAIVLSPRWRFHTFVELNPTNSDVKYSRTIRISSLQLKHSFSLWSLAWMFLRMAHICLCEKHPPWVCRRGQLLLVHRGVRRVHGLLHTQTVPRGSVIDRRPSFDRNDCRTQFAPWHAFQCCCCFILFIIFNRHLPFFHLGRCRS